MLFQHDPSEPVGVWLELAEDWRGLKARGRLIPDVMRARELLSLLKAGAVDGLSIGYRTVRGQIDPKSRVRRLYQVDLWEISIVTFPLLNGARVSAVKQAAPKLSRLREAAEAEWRAMLAGEDISAPRAPRVPLASRLGERTGARPRCVAWRASDWCPGRGAGGLFLRRNRAGPHRSPTEAALLCQPPPEGQPQRNNDGRKNQQCRDAAPYQVARRRVSDPEYHDPLRLPFKL